MINITNQELIKEAFFRALCVLFASLGVSASPAIVMLVATSLAHIIGLIYTGKIERVEQAEDFARARAEMPDFAGLRVSLTNEAYNVISRPDSGQS